MTAADNPAAATLSGREIALLRRQAMAQHGKAGVVKASQTKIGQTAYGAARQSPILTNASSGVGRVTAPSVNAFSDGAAFAPSTAPKRAALERRQALSQMGKAALSGAGVRSYRAAPLDDCGCNAAAPDDKTACACQTAPARAPDHHPDHHPGRHTTSVMSVALAVDQAGRAIQPVGKALARARRTALSQGGKSGIKRAEQAIRIAPSLPSQDGQTAIVPGTGGRQAAMQHRKVRALIGTDTANHAATRPSAHVRTRPALTETSPKIEAGPTLSGNAVTGTMIERSRKVTGSERGSCRAVTGTEYLPANMYDKFCPTRPAAAPAKVVSEATPKGKTISGTLVGRPSRVTGGEMGADRAITGTSYSRPSADTAPPKTGVTHTYGAMKLTGTMVGSAPKVTGDEPGACRSVTGSQYLSAEHFKELCRSEVPAPVRRVSVMSTPAGQTLTGSAVVRSRQVTGDEAGACRAVTGSQYFNAKDFGVLCDDGGPRKVAMIETGGRAAVPQDQHVSKVGIDRTISGQRVTGSAFGRSKQVTGDERGACVPVSGASYIGQDQYQSFCGPDDVQAQSARVRDRASISAAMVSGDRPGAGGMTMTGDERGACIAVTGVPYIGFDNRAPNCLIQPETSNRFLLRQRPAAPDKPAAPADFSIRSPARVAWDADRETRAAIGAVTGTAYGAADRITGPGNKARGLITGTPEFRHHESASAQPRNDARGDRAANNVATVAKTQRLSGEAQIHERVTGDAWQAQSRVSGTEGRSSTVRNPSQRGNARGALMDARRSSDVEKPPAAANLVTGSSGNTGRGPLVTVSGGARA
ncbi:MAG: CsoS2 family carboxysome shell protein [Acidiphilium sp.]